MSEPFSSEIESESEIEWLAEYSQQGAEHSRQLTNMYYQMEGLHLRGHASSSSAPERVASPARVASVEPARLGSPNVVQDFIGKYLRTLNTASEEELRVMRGIGVKRASKVMEVREHTPFTSLEDLDMIGLSMIQARGILTKEFKRQLEQQIL